MYKGASDGHQRALRNGRPSDWINGEERLSEADNLKQLQDGVKIIEARILALPAGEERKRLGVEKNAMQLEIKALRAARPKPPIDWKQHFVSEAKRMLSPSQFEMIENAAKHEAARVQARNDAASAARTS